MQSGRLTRPSSLRWPYDYLFERAAECLEAGDDGFGACPVVQQVLLFLRIAREVVQAEHAAGRRRQLEVVFDEGLALGVVGPRAHVDENDARLGLVTRRQEQ